MQKVILFPEDMEDQYFTESLYLIKEQNKRAPLKRTSKTLVIDYPTHIAQGPFCWISSGHKTQFYHEKISRENSFNRKLGYKPLNSPFYAAHVHHLHLENNKEFCIHIPKVIHEFYPHNAKNPESLTSINTVALDFWVNETFYKELFELKSITEAQI